MTPRSSLVRGEVMHARADAYAHRAFRYPVYVAAVDLAELPALDRDLRLFSRDRANVFSFHARDYASLDDLADLRAANGIPAPASTVLVTNLRVFHYTFNPVSFFLDHDASGALTSVIAEVNNTYGGRFRYLLGPRDRLPADAAPPGLRGAIGFRHVRELFVSPFLHGPAIYDFWFDVPAAGDLAIVMHVHQGHARTFTARLAGSRVPLTDRALVAAAIRYPLMTVQVIALIHLQAWRLRRAGVPYRASPPGHRPLDRYPERSGA